MRVLEGGKGRERLRLSAEEGFDCGVFGRYSGKLGRLFGGFSVCLWPCVSASAGRLVLVMLLVVLLVVWTHSGAGLSNHGKLYFDDDPLGAPVVLG